MKLLRLSMTLMFVLFTLAATADNKITIVAKGESTLICVDENIISDSSPGLKTRWDKQSQADKGRRNLQDAIKDLQYYLQKISAAKVSINKEMPGKNSKDFPILIGKYAEKYFGAVAKKTQFGQAWRLVVSAKGIGLIGESDEAVAYAIYELLDKIGCRWFMPGELGESIPSLSEIKLSECDISGVPSTIARNVSGINLISPIARDFFRRNRLGGMWVQSSHALSYYISREDYEKHPEWLAQINGERKLHRTPRLCWSNLDAAKAVADVIIKKLDKKYVPSISLAPADGMVSCECEKCKALDTGDWDNNCGTISVTDRLIYFCNHIAVLVNKKYPEVKFGLLAYVNYTQAPVREKVNPNIIVTLAPIGYCRHHSMKNIECPTKQDLYKIMKAWAKTCDNIGLYEYGYHLAEMSAPCPFIKKWTDDLDIFYDLFKGKNILWVPECTSAFEAVLPGLYMGIRRSFNAELAPEAILSDLYEKFYGSAAGNMRKYWETIDAAWRSSNEHTGCGFGYHFRFTPAVMKEARNLLDKALVDSTNIKIFKRVKMADESFRMFELFMQMRWNFLDGRFKGLKAMSTEWMGASMFLHKEYTDNFVFAPYGVHYFKSFFYRSYLKVDEINSKYEILTKKPLKDWNYTVLKKNSKINKDWFTPSFNDRSWGKTDICRDTWSSMGMHDYFGTMYYRIVEKIPGIKPGKKVYLLISSSDGESHVFVNGKAVKYINDNGKEASSFTGFCQPAAFDITDALKPGQANTLAISCKRTYLNEIGTGGLMGPIIVYQNK